MVSGERSNALRYAAARLRVSPHALDRIGSDSVNATTLDLRPQEVHLHAVAGVNEDVPHVSHLRPRHAGVGRSDVLREPLDRLAHDLQVPGHSSLHDGASPEVLSAGRGELLDLQDRVADVPRQTLGSFKPPPDRQAGLFGGESDAVATGALGAGVARSRDVMVEPCGG